MCIIGRMDEQNNGDVQYEPNASETKGLSEVDLSSSKQADGEGNEQEQRQLSGMGLNDQLEFFETEGRQDYSEGDSSEGSPEQVMRGKDSDSTRGAFVTLSPSISPGKCICFIGGGGDDDSRLSLI